MADVKTATKTVYNTADGPRSVIGADGATHIVPPGGSVEAEFTLGELNNLHPDLSTTKPKADEPAPAPAAPSGSEAGAQTAEAQAKAIEELATTLEKGNTLEELQTIAKNEKVDFAKEDTQAQLALKIAQARLAVPAK